MKNSKLTYLTLIVFHALLALVVFVIPFISKIYALLIIIVGFIIVYTSKNKNNEVLFVSAYLVGAEVFLRMTGGNLNNEFAKFSVIFFMIFGMVYSNFSKNGLIYLVFLLLLVPAIFITISEAGIDVDLKKSLFFNLSGPLCIAMCAIYMFNRRIAFDTLGKVLIIMGFPIISITVYLFLYAPSIKDVVTGTQSNFETSGGFGPNQVSTILGLGMFIFFTQLILFSKSKIELFINSILFIFISYRGIVTFSRGGIMTAAAMIVCFLFLLYYFSNAKGKSKLNLIFILTGIVSIGVWTYSSSQTGGLIEKRYTNKDARGREKKDRLGGREEIMDAEINLFMDSPLLGVGAGLSKSKREEELGGQAASHSEITRLLAEHGVFGIVAFLILVTVPFVVYINNKQHLYFLPFIIFWLLTINHAAMRTAAPAFVYALSLLFVQVKIPEETEN
ncbi:O-antigen ligase family protein [Flavobacterium humidisoli]|uniref:O-antigen ligase family protein n=1 Tax=Flavobacterium humidisoli TaxID=2937442 RepID=A0ABY4LSJ6_9FLAO|nr:O-antigen ligase family protein [Flavobacterium humidisoli]UPZ16028.1 O-antigen ligase family protein [Flavobacterium humidisoli]